MTSLRIYHDAFLQSGGAEKVAAIWSENFKLPVEALASSSDLHYLGNLSIRPILKFIRTQKQLEFVYPFLPLINHFIPKSKEEVRLVSTTGVAHQIPGNWKNRIIYFHGPARWIWDKQSFDINRSKTERKIADSLRFLFKKYDKRCVTQADILIANSNATREKILEIYGMEARVIFPPVSPFLGKSSKPRNFMVEGNFFLQVGRVRGYKGQEYLASLFNSMNFTLVMVGSGTENINTRSVVGLGHVTDSELKWLYENAAALLAVSLEDFGLTPVEASFFGCPTIAFKHLGYLDSVKEGISGVFVKAFDDNSLKNAIKNHKKDNFDAIEMKNFAKRFSIDQHIKQLKEVISES